MLSHEFLNKICDAMLSLTNVLSDKIQWEFVGTMTTTLNYADC